MSQFFQIRATGSPSDNAAMHDTVIYHNPKCGTSRNTLALLRHAGLDPQVVLYLETPLNRAQLVELIAAAGLSVRQALREKCDPYAELGLAAPHWTDDQLLDFMVTHPILLNRPFVVTPKGAALCRPSEKVLALLPQPLATPFTKEDGEVVG